MEQEIQSQNFQITKIFGQKKTWSFSLKKNQKLLILQDPKQVEKLKYFNLNYCMFKWYGLNKRNFYFSMKANKEKAKQDKQNIKFKKLMISHEQELIANEWYQMLSKLSLDQDLQANIQPSQSQIQEENDKSSTSIDPFEFDLLSYIDENIGEKLVPRISKITSFFNTLDTHQIQNTDNNFYSQLEKELQISNDKKNNPVDQKQLQTTDDQKNNPTDKQQQDIVQNKNNSDLQTQNINIEYQDDQYQFWEQNLGYKIFQKNLLKPYQIKQIIKALNNQVQFKNCLNKNSSLQIQDIQYYTLDDFLKFKDFERQPDNSLFYTNQVMIQNQRHVLNQMIKNFAKNVLMGQSLMSISLPVTVFEPQSFLERLCETFIYFPTIINKIKYYQIYLKIGNQIKYIVTYAVTSVLLSIGVGKPFNPILGETKQYKLNNFQLSVEQISHHPPISYFYIKSDNVRHYGPYQVGVSHAPNHIIIKQEGQFIIEVNSNKFIYVQPQVKLYGTLIGQRKMAVQDQGTIFDLKNDIIVIFKVKKDSEISDLKSLSDEITGGIYQLKPGMCSKYLKKQPVKLSQSDIVVQLSDITGNISQQIFFDSVLYFDFQKEKGYKNIQQQNPLMSDSIFRLDSLYLKANLMDESQKAKEEIENIEREYQKYRKKNKK